MTVYNIEAVKTTPNERAAQHSPHTLTSMEMAVRLSMRPDTLCKYKMYEGFPHHSYKRVGLFLMWNPVVVEEWFVARANRVKRGAIPKFIQVAREQKRIG
jgi:hypothetical protein